MTVQSSVTLTQSLRKVALTATVLGSALLFAACAPSTTTTTEEQAPGMTTEKQGDTTLSGTIVKMEDKYYIQNPSRPQQEVDSYSIDLSTYEGKSVKVTGQFSGTTLFAGQVEEQ